MDYKRPPIFERWPFKDRILQAEPIEKDTLASSSLFKD